MLIQIEHNILQTSAPSDVSPAEPNKKRPIGFAPWKEK
jgi:hypothetical protein